MKKLNHFGYGAIEIILIIVALGIVGGTGFYVYNANKKDVNISDSSIQKSETKTEEKQESAATPKYIDLRVNGDTTGVEIKTAADVDKLTGVGDKLKVYLKSTVGTEDEVMEGGKAKRTYRIDRIYGNYAAGVASTFPAYLIFGPENGTGAIGLVAATQDLGMSCDDLKKAKVPSELVDGRCLISGESEEIVPYTN